MPINDEEAAALAISSLADYSEEQQDAHHKINTILKSGHEDSFVDIHELFALYNTLYFRSLLLPRVVVSWSPRLTLCAGICELMKDDEGKYRRMRLKLSSSLLQFRPRSDVLNTLLHESIHAYFFITSSFSHTRDPTGGHGPGFQLLASAINDHGGYDITQFHEFHDEVDSYRRHVWLCDGPCQTKPPFFGLVKRAMNRPPGKGDTWWKTHEEECGGTYQKIAEPDITKKQLEAMSGIQRAGRQKNKIDGWVKRDAFVVTNESSEKHMETASQLKKRAADDDDREVKRQHFEQVSCPICSESLYETEMNEHLDAKHPI